MVHRTLSLYIATTLLLLAGTVNAHAQTSLIDTISQAGASVVSVKARLPPYAENNARETARQGAGVIIDESGIIVTNLHTVKFSDKLIVELADGQRLDARIIELWPAYDLALLKVSAAHPLAAVAIGDSDRLQLGQEIINIGTSVYRKDSISGGRVTALGRSQTTGALEIIRVDLDLYQGDSGGPLFDRRGELIGMLNSKDRGQPRHGYAIASNKIKNLYLSAIK